MALAEKLRELRIQRSWTQLEVSKRSGLDRRYVSYLEQTRHAGRPSADALLKLARTFNVKPDELYEAAGYINGSQGTSIHNETPEEILDRLRLATPVSIPVYPWEAFPFHAGDPVEPIEYVYRARPKLTSKNIEAYVVHGNCLEPKINDGDVIIVDRESSIDNGDIVACLVDNEFHVLRVRKVTGDLWLENNFKKYKFEECQEAATVIECIRRLK